VVGSRLLVELFGVGGAAAERVLLALLRGVCLFVVSRARQGGPIAASSEVDALAFSNEMFGGVFLVHYWLVVARPWSSI